MKLFNFIYGLILAHMAGFTLKEIRECKIRYNGKYLECDHVPADWDTL